MNYLWKQCSLKLCTILSSSCCLSPDLHIQSVTSALGNLQHVFTLNLKSEIPMWIFYVSLSSVFYFLNVQSSRSLLDSPDMFRSAVSVSLRQYWPPDRAGGNQ